MNYMQVFAVKTYRFKVLVIDVIIIFCPVIVLELCGTAIQYRNVELHISRVEGELSVRQTPQRVHYGSLSLEATRSLFESFADQYGKSYVSRAHKEKRFEIFRENLKQYDAKNAAEKGSAVYGIDKFSDWTYEEFKQKMARLNVKALKEGVSETYDDPSLENVRAPKNFDWREKGAVTPIKAQGSCGSCWAFSTVANLEGLYQIKYKTLETFSEQQLVDCDPKSDGCKGGFMEDAVNYIKDAGGLQLNATYPYVARDQTCRFDKNLAVLKVKKNVMLPPRKEKKMAAYLFKNGPISIALDSFGMWGYRGGIAHPSESGCSKDLKLADHGIAFVGYGVQVDKVQGKVKRTPFWIGKNSWGTQLCDKGYFYVYRGDNTCGVANLPSSAVLL
ncbi:unnamed protein product [Bemisia tabaci]|uniref:Uncharacterized protein n=1 Tax=Bemisia tabaci TaxID=7038 RepID=A0A9P0G438_BEMTA|nr:unnamed protein product [Bemisia tabaci]